MEDCDNTTCQVELEENTSTMSPLNQDRAGLKRSLQDEGAIEEEALRKKMRTEAGDDRVSEVAREEKAGLSRNKKKCVLLLSYCGAGYNGMQINPGVRTIEEELINALYKVEAITEDAKACLGKMSFQRCARTDKGVSAARQVVSLKMVPEQSMLPKINMHLPPEIRVIAMKRTTRGFDAKDHCSARTYEYVAPTYAFAEDSQTTSNYRITEEKIGELNEVLSKFTGTHNYHNFTSGKKYSDPSAKRYIIKFKCGRTFEKDEREFITISIKGQSFMLHQIRKMIGLVLAITRGVVPMSVLDLARKEEKVDIPRAPAVGLVLDQVHFDAYDRRYGDDGIHERLQWDDYEEEIQQFKDQFIYKHIVDTEIRENVMHRWLRTLREHFAMNEKLKDLQPESDQDGADRRPITQTTAKTKNTAESSSQEGGNDVIQIADGEEKDKEGTTNAKIFQNTKNGNDDEEDQIEKSKDL